MDLVQHYQLQWWDALILEAALRDFGPAKLFDIPVLNPEQTFQHFGLTVTRSCKP
jgi:hypothetical protein